MTDIHANKPIQVQDQGVGGPYIPVKLDQLPQIRAVLDRHQVRYWVDNQAISYDDRPYVVVINLGLKGDAGLVQSILDGAE